jgi:hypothetical protein
MDRMKILVVLLVISLAGNVFFLVTGGNNPVSDGIRQSMLYAYHQAFPPLDNETFFLTGNESNPTDTNITEAVQPGNEKEFTARDILLMLEKNEVSDEEILQMLLTLENETLENGTLPEEEVEVNVTPTPDPNAWKVYESSKWHFSVPYPPSWTVKEGTQANSVVTITAPIETSCSAETKQCYQYVASLSISIDTNPGTGSLEEYFNKKIASLQRQLAITATSKSATTIVSGERAYWIEYYTRDSRGNPSKRYMQYFALLDKKVYILTYSGPYSTNENVYSRNKADVQKMIEEFSVTREYVVV